MEGAPEVQERRFGDGSREGKAAQGCERATCRNSENACRAGADAFRAKAKDARDRKCSRRAERRPVEQIRPAQPAWPPEDVIDMKGCPDRPDRDSHCEGVPAKRAGARRTESGAFCARRKRERRADQRREHCRVFKRASVMLDGAVGKDGSGQQPRRALKRARCPRQSAQRRSFGRGRALRTDIRETRRFRQHSSQDEGAGELRRRGAQLPRHFSRPGRTDARTCLAVPVIRRLCSGSPLNRVVAKLRACSNEM